MRTSKAWAVESLSVDIKKWLKPTRDTCSWTRCFPTLSTRYVFPRLCFLGKGARIGKVWEKREQHPKWYSNCCISYIFGHYASLVPVYTALYMELQCYQYVQNRQHEDKINVKAFKTSVPIVITHPRTGLFIDIYLPCYLYFSWLNLPGSMWVDGYDSICISEVCRVRPKGQQGGILLLG